MKSEQRLMLALALTFGILLFWSVLSPAPQPPPVEPPPPTAETQLVRKSTGPEDLHRFKLGLMHLGVGKERGSIRELEADGVTLLSSEQGYLEVDWAKPSTKPLVFKSKWAGQTLTSRAIIDEDGSEVIRTLSQAGDPRLFLFEGSVRVINRSSRSKPIALRLSTFQPVVSADQEAARYQTGFLWTEGRPQELPKKLKEPKRYPGTPGWVTSQGKSHALIFEPRLQGGLFHVEQSEEDGPIVGWLELPEATLAPSAQTEWKYRLYAGPINLGLLEQIGMEEMVSFGMFSGVARFLLKFLDWGYVQLGNYGLSICLLSCAVWLPFSPITWYGMKSSTQTMKKMATVKPIEARIRKEHAKNPQKMQQELMQMYKKHGINPAAGCIGCLPFLFQWPIYIALFAVLNRAPQLRGAEFLWMKDLAGPDALVTFPAALPLIGPSFNILPILATVGMFFQQQLMQQAQSANMTDEQKMQQRIFKFLPIMLLIFFYQLPSGFMLYWVVYSVFMAGQQFLIKRVSH